MDKNLNSPTVSVLMCVFNGEPFVSDAIESILNQTYDNFEFVIVDDGSTDRSSSIIEKYCKEDRRIKVLTNPKNKGLIYSLNHGLDHCHGKYIVRLDADDVAFQARIECQVQFMENNPDHVLTGSAYHIEGSDRKILHVNESDDNLIRLKLLTNSQFAHPSVIIRNEIVQKNRLKFDASYFAAEDYEFWTRLIKYGKATNLSAPLIIYRQHSKQVSIEFEKEQKNTQKSIVIKQFKELGIDYSERKLDLINGILYNQYQLSVQFLKEVQQLILEIINANQKSNYVNQLFLEKYLIGRWKKMTWGSSFLGLSFFQLFITSPLSNTNALSKWFIIKLFMKSIVRV